jgi:hypothetical protein
MYQMNIKYNKWLLNKVNTAKAKKQQKQIIPRRSKISKYTNYTQIGKFGLKKTSGNPEVGTKKMKKFFFELFSAPKISN